MTKITQHVIPKTGHRWGVQKSTSNKASKNFTTQAKAVEYGQKLSRNQGLDLVVHRETGSIKEIYAYAKKRTA